MLSTSQSANNRWITLFTPQIIAAIGTETTRPSSAAQCVAYVAVAELAVGQWNGLITVLVENVVNAQSSELKKEATLEAIGKFDKNID